MKKTAEDIIILHKCTKNHNHIKYRSWDTEWDTEFFVIFGHFLPFYPPHNRENQNFKMKKASEDVIILDKCTKNHNHMMYASWDMEYDRQNFLSIWAIFCPFTPLLTPKLKIWNKCNKTLEILSYYTCVP